MGRLRKVLSGEIPSDSATCEPAEESPPTDPDDMARPWPLWWDRCSFDELPANHDEVGAYLRKYEPVDWTGTWLAKQ